MDPANPHDLRPDDQPVLETLRIAISGQHDEHDAKRVEEALRATPGVNDVKMQLGEGVVEVKYDARHIHADALHDAVLKSGHKAAPVPDTGF